MTENKMKTLLNCLGSIALSSALIACGGANSDPLSGYSVKGVDPHNDPAERMTTFENNKITVLPVGADESNMIVNDFIVGQSSSLQLKVEVRDPKITQYSLSLTDFPSSPNAPTLNESGTKGTFIFSWNPHEGAVPMGSNGAGLNVKVSAVVTAASDPDLIGIIQTSIIPINVSRHRAVPVIRSYTNLTDGLIEGTPKNFYVEVQDPSSDSGVQPQVFFFNVPYTNTEAFCADFSYRVRPTPTNHAQKVGSVWRFNYQINTDDLPNDRDRRGQETSATPFVDVCFYAVARGAGGTISNDRKIQTKAFYSAQNPEIKWEVPTENQLPLTAGEESKIRFELSTSNGLGQLSLPNLTRNLNVLSGTKALECQDVPGTGEQASNKKNCELTWTPACPAANRPESAIKLVLNVRNTVGSRQKTVNFEREFKVTRNEANCMTPAQRVVAEREAIANLELPEPPPPAPPLPGQTAAAATAEVSTQTTSSAAAVVEEIPLPPPQAPPVPGRALRNQTTAAPAAARSN